jgi:hypothetical protein
MEHNIREGFAAEKAMEEAEAKRGKKNLRDYVREAGFEAFRQG